MRVRDNRVPVEKQQLEQGVGGTEDTAEVPIRHKNTKCDEVEKLCLIGRGMSVLNKLELLSKYCK